MDILGPLVGKMDYHVKNSKDFATEIVSVMIEEGERLRALFHMMYAVSQKKRHSCCTL